MTAYTFGVIQFAFVTDIVPVPIHNVPGQTIYPGPLSLCTNSDIYNRNMTRASSRHSFSLSVNLFIQLLCVSLVCAEHATVLSTFHKSSMARSC